MPDTPLISPLLNELPQVLVIEREINHFPWSEHNLQSCFTSDYQNFGIWSADGTQLHGFILVHQALADEWTIMNIGVAKKAQRQGLAERLVGHVCALAAGKGAQLFLEVRENNEAARKLYSKLGFVEIGRRKNYYPSFDDAREAAIIMRWGDTPV